MKLKLAFACALSVLPLESVYATPIELTARPGGADIVDWGQLGTPNLLITTPQSFTSVGGITGTVNLNGTIPTAPVAAFRGTPYREWIEIRG
jgi:hypothetical protein